MSDVESSTMSTTPTMPTMPNTLFTSTLPNMTRMPTLNLTCPPSIVEFANSDNKPVTVNWSSPVLTESGKHGAILCSPRSGSMLKIGKHIVNCSLQDQNQTKGDCAFKVVVKGRCA